jgi:hypothetical protein
MRSALRGEGVGDRGDLAWGGAATIVLSSLGGENEVVCNFFLLAF